MTLTNETCLKAAVTGFAVSVIGIGLNHLIRTFTYKSRGNPCRYYNCNDVENVLISSAVISSGVFLSCATNQALDVINQ